jgi:hypothetical protein
MDKAHEAYVKAANKSGGGMFGVADTSLPEYKAWLRAITAYDNNGDER